MNIYPDTVDVGQRMARIRDYVAKDKPKVVRKDFAFKEPLAHGWLLPYLLGLDALTWKRWEHWNEVLMAERLLGPIPKIVWSAEHREGSHGWKAYESALKVVIKSGDWAGWSSWTYFDYFLDWLLYGFGDPSQKTEPKEPDGCEGASVRLYQLFNLEPLLAYPYDYLGDILASNNFGRHSGFFPTPLEVCEMMVSMQIGDDDARAKTCCDPCVGTGRMLLAASNYSYRLFGNDISATVLKAAKVNGYLYAPWLVRPFPFLQNYQDACPESEPLPNVTIAIEKAAAALPLAPVNAPHVTTPPSKPRQIEFELV